MTVCTTDRLARSGICKALLTASPSESHPLGVRFSIRHRQGSLDTAGKLLKGGVEQAESIGVCNTVQETEFPGELST